MFTPRAARLIMVGVTIAGCLLVVALAEGAVRVRQWIKHGDMWGIEESYAVDPESGLRVPIKNSVTGPIAINSLGFRSPEIAVPKPPGTLRLAFLGGSTTYCAEVSGNDRTWPELVWRSLQEHWPEATIDYLNAGVPGYTLDSLQRSLQFRVRAFDPDVIVIYEATNDLSATSYELAVRQGLVTQRTEEAMSWPSRYSLLWYLVEKNLLVMRHQAEGEKSEGKLQAEPSVLAEPFRGRLRALVTDSRAVAPLVVLITFSQRLRHDQTPEQRQEASITSRYYMPYMSNEQALAGFDAFNAVIREVALESDALLVEGEDSIPADGGHFVDSVHFTDTGSAAQAARVAEALENSPAFAALVATAEQVVH